MVFMLRPNGLPCRDFSLLRRLCLCSLYMYLFFSSFHTSSKGCTFFQLESYLSFFLGLKQSKFTDTFLGWVSSSATCLCLSSSIFGKDNRLIFISTLLSSVSDFRLPLSYSQLRQNLMVLGDGVSYWAGTPSRLINSSLILEMREEVWRGCLSLTRRRFIPVGIKLLSGCPIPHRYISIVQNMRPKSAMLRKIGTIDHEMDHQNQKNKMLEEDRRLFVRQAEEIKEKYQDEIEKLRGENKKLKGVRDELIAAKKQRKVFHRTSYGSSFSSGKFHSSATDENHLRILLDKEKHETKQKKNMLYTLQDKLKEVEDNKMGYIEENPMMKTIRLLENRLDKVMIKYNEAQSIQQTYNEVVKRLKEERVGYDSQLAAIENCLKGKEHDFEELLLLAHDATHAKEAAFGELKRFEQRRVTVQEMRNKYLHEKKEEMNRDVPQASEAMPKNERSTYNRPNMAFGGSYKHDENYQRQELSDYEEAFRKLKEVTGVVDANEIIQKFKTQGLTTQSLEEMQQNYAAKIEGLKDEKEGMRKQLQNSKFVRQEEGPERRRLDEIESELAAVTNQFERTNLKYGKLSGSMINIKAGVQHLRELTAFYKVGEESGGSLEGDLKVLSEKLRRMYDVVKNDPNYTSQNYRANANVIQSRLNESRRPYGRGSEDDSDQD